MAEGGTRAARTDGRRRELIPPREGDLIPDLPRAAIDVIGYTAAALTTGAFIPQVVKSWRSRSTEDLSAVMLVAFTAGIVLWLLYGLALGSRPVILANGITLVLSATLVGLKLLGPR